MGLSSGESTGIRVVCRFGCGGVRSIMCGVGLGLLLYVGVVKGV